MFKIFFSENFRVVNESGNYDDWKYSVEYTEHLRNLPSLKNTALGHYSVRQIEGGFLISSEHRTCFLFNTFGCCKYLTIYKKIMKFKIEFTYFQFEK